MTRGPTGPGVSVVPKTSLFSGTVSVRPLRLMRPVFAKLGMETSSRLVKIPEELVKKEGYFKKLYETQRGGVEI